MKDWKSILGAIAPTIATALGGPLAGTATKFLASNLLGDENKTQEEVENFILSSNPEQLASLKEIDNKFKLEMEKIGVDVFEIEANDKKNARSEHKHSNMPAVLSVSLSLMIVVIVYMLFYIEPPEGAREVLFMLLGVVVKEWGGSMQYWFGTTRSSSEKTRLLK